MNLNDPKIVVAIENAVCNQLEASGITADLFRLDGEKIIDVIMQQLEGFVLVPVKEIKTWYLDDSENIYREDPDWLCDTPIGEVVEVEHRISYELDQDPVFAAIQWDDVNGDVGYYETFKSKEEAEKVAAHCKAMKEAQEQGHG